MKTSGKRAVFLDRDGVLNPDVGHPHRISDARLFPDVVPALLVLQRCNLMLIVATNQSGVNRGLFSWYQLMRFNRALIRLWKTAGVRVSLHDFYICPHIPEDLCECRKPRGGLFRRAAADRGIDLTASFTIGDSESDIVAGASVGTTTVLLDRRDDQHGTSAAFRARGLLEAVAIIMKQARP